VPKSRPAAEIAHGIPATYVPARNTIFLANALAWAESIGATDIFIGVNALDYSGYPDCRPEFISAFEKMANLATKAGVEGSHFKIHTPLIGMSKAEIIGKAGELGIDFSLTYSCYDPAPDGRACGLCDSCQLRRKGFREAGSKIQFYTWPDETAPAHLRANKKRTAGRHPYPAGALGRCSSKPLSRDAIARCGAGQN